MPILNENASLSVPAVEHTENKYVNVIDCGIQRSVNEDLKPTECGEKQTLTELLDTPRVVAH